MDGNRFDPDPNFHFYGDQDPDPDSHQNEADPHHKCYTCWKIRNLGIASLHCFIFLISVQGVIILINLDNILKFSGKKYRYCLSTLSFAWNRSGSGKMIRIRPGPDPQDCS